MYTEEQLIEKFPKVDEDGTLTVDRLALKRHIVDRGVYVLKEIDVLKQDLKEIAEEAVEYAFNKAEINKLIKFAHKNSIESEIEELEEIQVKLDILYPQDTQQGIE